MKYSGNFADKKKRYFLELPFLNCHVTVRMIKSELEDEFLQRVYWSGIEGESPKELRRRVFSSEIPYFERSPFSVGHTSLDSLPGMKRWSRKPRISLRNIGL